jgi:hypothetical protein
MQCDVRWVFRCVFSKTPHIIHVIHRVDDALKCLKDKKIFVFLDIVWDGKCKTSQYNKIPVYQLLIS